MLGPEFICRRANRANGKKEKTLLSPSQGLIGSSNDRSCDFINSRPPTKKRSPRIYLYTKDKQLQKTTSTGKQLQKTVPDIVRENPLSKLDPPSKSDGFMTREEHLDLLDKATSVLIFEIENARNAKQMIDLSSATFTLLDKIGVDYLPLYKSACSFISHQYEKEVLYKEKPVSAFNTKAMHEKMSSSFSKFKERKPVVNSKVEATEHELAAITADLHHLEEEIRKTKEKKAICEANLAAAQAEKAVFDKSYSEEASKLDTIAAKMTEAQAVIDDYESRWKGTVDGLNHAKEGLLRLRK